MEVRGDKTNLDSEVKTPLSASANIPIAARLIASVRIDLGKRLFIPIR